MTDRNTLTRRNLLAGGVVAVAASATAFTSPAAPAPAKKAAFRYCFNTATILGQKLSLTEEIDIAAKAGYTGIEPWTRNVDAYVKSGGSLDDLRKRLEDKGITVESAIGFAQWIVDDDAQRAQGVEQMKREMDQLAQIGAKRIAAPPAGANREPGLDLMLAAERYRAILDIGDEIGVIPQVELWGSSKNLHRLGEAVFVAIESGHPKACVLPDVYHIYKGGSDHAGLGLLSSNAIQVIHMNDYPADPPREKIGDGDRVFPGDGIAPTSKILRMLRDAGGETILSLELFSRKYWEQDPLKVAREGLEKMQAAVDIALGK